MSRCQQGEKKMLEPVLNLWVLVRVASFIYTPDIPERCQGCKDHKNDKLKVCYMFGKLFFVIIV